MNLEDLLMAIQANVDRSNEDIEWGDEDTIVRIELVNRGIRRWASDNNTRWNELISTSKVGTAKAGANSFPLDDEYKLLEAVYDETGSPIEIKTIQESTRTGRYAFVSGNASDGYNLELGWQPEDDDPIVGQEIRVYSYRAPALLSKPKDVPEMPDPDYLVSYVSAELMIDDDTTQYGKYANDAALALANMRDRNDQLAQNQYYSALDDEEGLV